MEISRPGASLPGVQNSVIIAIGARCTEDHRGIGVAGIQRHTVLIRMWGERDGSEAVVPAPTGGEEDRILSGAPRSAKRVIESLHRLSSRAGRYCGPVINDHRLEREVLRQYAIDHHQARALGERQCGCSVRQRDRVRARGVAHPAPIRRRRQVSIHAGAIYAQRPVKRTVGVGDVFSNLLAGDGIPAEGSTAGRGRRCTFQRLPVQVSVDNVGAVGNTLAPTAWDGDRSGGCSTHARSPQSDSGSGVVAGDKVVVQQRERIWLRRLRLAS